MNQSQVLLRQVRLRRGIVFGAIIITALLAFELFNYSTTDYALADLLGDLKFLGLKWSTILAIAFCGIDFAGIARLFTPVDSAPTPSGHHTENWYLFGAWLLAATMNAMLTWWGVSLAVLGHQTLGNEVVSRESLVRIVPVFVAILVWLIRVLIIGTFSAAGDKLFYQDNVRQASGYRPAAQPRPATQSISGGSRAVAPRPVAAAPKGYHSANPNSARALQASQAQHLDEGSVEEPSYHPISPNNGNGNGVRPSSPGTPNRPTFTRPPTNNYRR
jgi:hypothetical protein